MSTAEMMTLVKSRRFGSTHGKTIMLVLADYANADWTCWVGQARLAAECEMSEASVYRYLKRFEDAGLIRRERRHRPDGTRTSDYITLIREAVERLPVTLTSSQSGETTRHPVGDYPSPSTSTTRHSLTRELLEEPLDEQSVIEPSRSDDRDAASSTLR